MRMRITEQSPKSFIRKRVTDENLPGSCPCGTNFSTVFYLWEHKATGNKFCMFCYKKIVGDVNENFPTLKTDYTKEKTANPNTKNGVQELAETWSDFPGLWDDDINDQIHERLEQNGPMTLCCECSKSCKVPLSPNVTNFVCVDFDGALSIWMENQNEQVS